MRFPVLLFLFLTSSLASCAQQSIPKVLERLNDDTVDYISVEDIQKIDTLLLLDAREKKEFDVSHLKNAIWVGYDEFDIHKVLQELPNKEKPIVVYCSIGVRSEDIGEKLKKAGYTNVKNLYGGIFEWKNEGHAVVNSKNQPTDSVHCYNRLWSVWLKEGIKVYD